MHDGVLIRRSLDAPALFGELFDRHAPAVLRYATARLGPAAAEDVAAETFLVAFERRARFEADREDARPWLLGIATNLIQRHRRSERRAIAALRRLPLEQEDADDPRPGDRVDAQRELAALAARLRRLSAADRDTLLLFAWGGLGYDEIAEAMHVPPGTVRSRLHRARRLLRGPDGREALGGSAAIAPSGP